MRASAIVGFLPLPASISRALPRNASAIIDELFNVTGVEPQRASSGSHFDGRQIWFALAGGVLDDPRCADPKFMGDIFGPDQLPYRFALGRADWREVTLDDSIRRLHKLLTDKRARLPLYDMVWILSKEDAADS